METIILKNIVENSSSNEQGSLLYEILEKFHLSNECFVLEIDSDLSMSSSFLNSSFGVFLDTYGLDNFKKTIKIKGSKNQFSRISDYIKDYTMLYLK